MTFVYNYSLSDDFGGSINNKRLEADINNDISITPLCTAVTVDEDAGNVTIVFVSALSGVEQSNLNGLVAAHVADHDPDIVYYSTGAYGTTTTLAANQSADRTVNIPDASGTLMLRTTADTMQNKTIDATQNTVLNLSNSAVAANAGISASKLANGTVSDAEFQRLDGVTDNIQTQLNNRSLLGHTHVAADISNFQSTVSANSDVAASVAHAADAGKHRVINDAGTASTELWSAAKINTQLATKSNTGHTHVAANIADFATAADARITAQKGQANGLATLDATGKVPASQLELDSVDYQGTWNADINSPTISGGVGSKGYYYVVGTAGATTIDGVSDWQVNDWIIFNGSVWQKADHSDQVTSVAGKQGAVTLVASDVTDFDAKVTSNVSVAANTAHAADVAKHRQIDDFATGATDLWSAAKISAQLATKSATGHTHTASNITDFDAKVASNSNVAANTTHRAQTDNPHSVTKAQVGLAEVQNLKVNLVATVPPTATDDSSAGYAVGSVWVDTVASRTYMCAKASVGAAVWRQTGIEAHANLTGVGSNTHAQIDSHIADSTLHFTKASIDHSVLQNVGTNTHAQIDSHLADVTKHRVINDAGTSATQLWSAAKIDSELSSKSNVGHTHTAANITNFDAEVGNHADVAANTAHRSLSNNPHSVTKAQLGLGDVDNLKNNLAGVVAPTPTDDSAAGYSVGSLWINTATNRSYTCVKASVGAAVWRQTGIESHAFLADIGSNTHAQIDAHLANSALHFSEASIDHTAIQNVGSNTHAQIDAHISDATKHRVINDASTSSADLWSASKISSQLATKSAVGHSHSAANITDFDTEVANNSDVAANTTHRARTDNPHSVSKAQVGLGNVVNLKVKLDATVAPGVNDGVNSGYSVGSTWIDVLADRHYVCVDASVGAAVWRQGIEDHADLANVGTNTHAQIDAHIADDSRHRMINDSGTSATQLWSASKISTQLAAKSDAGHTHVAANISDFATAADARITAQKGQANGLATLDGTGKVPASQLELDNVDYQGTWNADTNAPTLINATGTKGHYYVVSVAGSTTIDGVYDWQVGDWIIYNGSAWEKVDNTDQVTSVAGKQGAVTLIAADITDFDAEVSNNVSVAANTAHAADATKHRQIDDGSTAATALWSASKIASELGAKTDAGHTHTAANITDFDAEVDNNSSVALNTTHRQLTNNPHSVTAAQVGLGNVPNLKSKLDATAAPTSANDSSQGYAVGSVWINLTDNRYYVCVDATDAAAVWKDVTEQASEALLAYISGATHMTVQDMQNINHSAGSSSGGAITDAGSEQINVAGGTGMIRVSNSSTAVLQYFDWAGVTNQAIPTDSVRYVGVQYNGGAPQVVLRTVEDWNYNTDFALGCVVNEGGTLHIVQENHAVGDSASFVIQRLQRTKHFEKDQMTGGLVLGETGTRNLTVTAGRLWSKLRWHSIDALNTGAADSFDAYYRDGAGGWTKLSAQTAYSNTLYDNGSGTLQALTNNHYGVQWLFLDANGNLSLLFGRATHKTPADADMATVPSPLPDRLEHAAVLLGRLIFKKSASAAMYVQTTLGVENLSTTLANDHNNLSSLQGGTVGEYYHLSAAQHSAAVAHLTDTNNPHSVTAAQVGLGNVSNVKSKLDATAAPTATDDSAAGYSVGSPWVDVIANTTYQCVDSTATAAVWRRTDISSTSDVTEGTNLYYTDARFDTRLTTKDTDDLTEGSSNLYYTQARVTANSSVVANTTHRSQTDNPHSVTKAQIGLGNVNNLKSKLDAAVGPTANDDSTQGYAVGSLWINVNTDKTYLCVDSTAAAAVWRRTDISSTSDVDEGSNLYYTTARFDSQLATKDTDDIAEGAANLYYTEARVNANSNVALNTAHRALTDNPHSVTAAQLGLGHVANLKSKYDATAAPTVDNDSTEGYAVGSTWIDVGADRHYVCVDASVGAAVWRQGIEDHADLANIGTNTHAQIDTHIADSSKHRVINDSGTSTTELWSASKISAQLATKSDSGHTHVAANITDFSAAADARIAAQKAQANGLATLDGAGKVPASQLNLDNVDYQGTWNATTNTPTLASGTGTKGHYYVVSVAGATTIDGENDWQVSDWIIFNGAMWEKSDHSDQVSSVAGKQGAVVLVANDITNFDSEVANNGDVAANTAHRSLTNNPHSVTAAQLGLGNVANLKSKLDATVAPGVGDDAADGYSVGSLWIDVTADKSYQCVDSSNGAAVWRRTDIASTSDVAEGSNLYYTEARFDTRLAAKNTDNLTEGSNLYYTEARVNANSNVALNSTHRARTDNPHSVTAAQLGLGNVANLKAKLDATAAPTATDDSMAGYSVGSLWVDTTADRSYVCLDATAAGAVWRQTTVVAHSELSGIGTNTHAQIDAHLADDAKHRVINDAGASATQLWSSSKIATQLAAKSNSGHTHVLADLTDADLFENGGEAGGANRSLGNTDNYALALKTNNADRLAITADGLVSVGGNAVTDYRFAVENAAGKNGLRILAGGNENDLALNITNQANTSNLLQVHANGGQVVLGNTYSGTKSSNGTVYGLDNQHASGDKADINTVGNYRIGGKVTVMMTEFQEASSDDESSTTNTTFVQKLRMSTAALPSGKYRIGWQLEFKNNHRSGGEYRVQINDTTTLAQADGTDSSTPGFTTESGFYYASSISGVQNIDIDFRALGGTTYVQAARLEIWRVS